MKINFVKFGYVYQENVLKFEQEELKEAYEEQIDVKTEFDGDGLELISNDTDEEP